MFQDLKESQKCIATIQGWKQELSGTYLPLTSHLRKGMFHGKMNMHMQMTWTMKTVSKNFQTFNLSNHKNILQQWNIKNWYFQLQKLNLFTVQWSAEYMSIHLDHHLPHPFAKWEPNYDQIGFDLHVL